MQFFVPVFRIWYWKSREPQATHPELSASMVPNKKSQEDQVSRELKFPERILHTMHGLLSVSIKK